MNAFKQQCIDLREQDHTLTEIAKITGRPKTSVYVHIQNLPLSAAKKQAVARVQGERARQMGLKRRGISTRHFRKINHWNVNNVSLVAHLLFDGEIKHSHCTYHNRNIALLDLVERHMRNIYQFEPKRYFNQATGVSRISYYNVALGDHMGEKATQLLKEVFQFPNELKREFVKSFFDDEGCMDFRPKKNTRRIRGYQKNVEILKIIQKLLLDFGIRSFVQKPNEIVIAYKENLQKFQNEIGFSHGVRINGNRSNSIWKQSLEKRLILRKAIASYKPVGSNGVHRR